MAHHATVATAANVEMDVHAKLARNVNAQLKVASVVLGVQEQSLAHVATHAAVNRSRGHN